MKKLFFLAFAAFALAACSDDKDAPVTPIEPPVDPPVEPTSGIVIDFETADLGTENFIWGKELATVHAADPLDNKSKWYYGAIFSENQVRVYTYFLFYVAPKDEKDKKEAAEPVDVWAGFVVSKDTDRITDGYKNDKSVYAESGAGDSKQFAVGYYSPETVKDRGIPVLKFTTKLKPVSVAIANTTYPFRYFKKANTDLSKIKFDVVATGYNAKATTGSVRIPMIVDGKMVEDWRTADLSELGEVTSIQFTVECPDEMAPTYFAIDDFTYETL